MGKRHLNDNDLPIKRVTLSLKRGPSLGKMALSQKKAVFTSKTDLPLLQETFILPFSNANQSIVKLPSY